MFEPEEAWIEPRDPRIAPRIARIGFFLAGVGMGLGSLSHMLRAIGALGQNLTLLRLLTSTGWDLFVITPATVGNAFAAFILIGMRTDRDWRTRAVLLALIQTYFLAHWCGQHHAMLGLPAPPAILSFDPWIELLWRVLGFAAVLTLARMAAEAAGPRGAVDAEGIYRSTRGTAAFGLMLWTLFAMRVVRFESWPPRIAPIRDVQTYLIYNGSFLCRALAGFFTTALCALTCVLNNRELLRLQAAHRDHDPFAERR